jgi:hypothetical protein
LKTVSTVGLGQESDLVACGFFLLLLLTLPVHETFGDEGSCASSKHPLLAFVLASFGTSDTIRPDKPLSVLDMRGLVGGLWNVTGDAACGRQAKTLNFDFLRFPIKKEIAS